MSGGPVVPNIAETTATYGPDWDQELRVWVEDRVRPDSNFWEETQSIPEEILDHFGDRGWFGAALPPRWGGLGLNSEGLGRFCAILAGGSVSLLSIFVVHNMVAQALLRWGDEAQQAEYLPRLASGRLRAAFALTEPGRGSEAANLECSARRHQGGFLINGEKKWISGAERAGLFLVMATLENEGLGAFLLPGETKGLTRSPMKDLLGFRGAGVSELKLANCAVPAEALIGASGEGFTFVASQALDCGRFMVGWGAVGLMEACLEAAVNYASERRQFGDPLRKHQLIQALIADMAVALTAGRALAEKAARARDDGSPDSVLLTAGAKYFCSRAALKAAEDAIQIHGANGCGPEYPLVRYYRDAKICEIIEGSNQMQQLMIAAGAFRRWRRKKRGPQ